MAPHIGVLLGLTWLYFDDNSRFHAPLLGLAAEELRAGRLPLWNPYIGLGNPLLAERGSLLAYPVVWLACLVHPTHALGAVLVVQMGVLAAGGAALLRDLDALPATAATGGAALGLCGPVVSWFDTSPYLVTLSYLPLVLLHARRMASGVRGSSVALGLCGGLALLGGDLFGTAVTGALALAFHLSHGGRRFGGLAVAGGIALAVGAGAWIPTLWSLPLSERAAGIGAAEAGRWSTHPAEWLGFLWPNPLGLPLPRFSFWPMRWHGERLFVHSLYPGAAIAMAALGSLRTGRTPGRWLVLAALPLLLLATGSTLPLWALSQPVFTFVRYPSKLVPYAVVLLVLGGALALGRASGAGSRPIRIAVCLGAALSLAGGLCGPLLIRALAPGAGAPAEANEPAASALVVACLRAGAVGAAIAIALQLAHRGRLAHGRAALLVGALAVVDHYVNAETLSWTRAPAEPAHAAYMPAAPPWGPRAMRLGEVGRTRLALDEAAYVAEIARLEALLQPARNVDQRTGVLEGYGLFLGEIGRGMSEIIAKDPIALAEITGSDRVLAAPDRPAGWLQHGVETGRLVPLGAVRAGAVVFDVPGRMPRAFLAASAIVVPSDQEAARVAAGDGRRGPLLAAGTALIGGRPAAADVAALVQGLPAGPSPVVAIAPSAWNPTEIRFDAEIHGRVLLVLMDAWADGWRGFVDGGEVPILRANRLGRAVVVPGGRHAVTFRHRPALLVASVSVSWCALALVIAALVWLRPGWSQRAAHASAVTAAAPVTGG